MPLKVGEEAKLTDPTIRIGSTVEVTDPALNTYGMRGQVSGLYPAIRHWQVRIQGPYNNIVLKVLRREQFEPLRDASETKVPV